MKSERTR